MTDTPPADRRALLQDALRAVETMQARLDAMERARSEPIAIIGMGCRFPGGADTPDAYWQLLRDGVDATSDVPSDRWDGHRYYDPDRHAAGKMVTRRGGFLERVDLFEPGFFGISPREAMSLDPQQRLLLEVAWEALEDAGCAPDRLRGSQTGVFVGISIVDYAKVIGAGDAHQSDVYAATGNALNAASGRLSFVLGLHGPAVSVDTACSSSLTATHLACQSLRNGECDLALAGGVNVVLLPDAAILFSKWGMLAPDGRCKTFDGRADGFVRSEGCGVVALKRLSAALTDGDRVLAVIRGSAVNQDGASSGLTVPNGLAQQAVVRRALKAAGVEPADVDYVEAHGTGTPLGDPIEVEALAAVMDHGRPDERPLYIGSVKTNIGHAEAASGVAGLIKVVLALQRGEIPPHLHLQELNPRIPWKDYRIAVPTQRIPWPGGGKRRLAGVSSFGFSGTNAHLVVEEAPVSVAPEAPAPVERPLHLVTVSGRTEAGLTVGAERLAAHLDSSPDLSLADVGFTRNAGRSHLPHRAAVVARDGTEARERLRAVARNQEAAGIRRGAVEPGQRPRMAWLFTGQGSQYVGMGRSLYETSPVFRRALDRCAAALRPRLERPLLDVIFGAGAERLLDETAYTQPALFALEWALAELWRSWGLTPVAVMGHSVGELSAAAAAGILTPEDGVTLAAERGRLMQACPRGAMAAVLAGEEAVTAVLEPFRGALSLAAVNGPESTVVSGEPGALDAFRARCDAAGIRTKPLTVSHAFHSSMMEPMLDGLEACARRLAHADPEVELISNVTGEPVKAGDLGPGYWRRHAREAVRFAASMNVLRDRGCDAFLEIGPGPTLLGMGRRCIDGGLWLPSLRPGQPEWSTLLESLADLYVHGAPVDWAGFDAGWPRRRLSLPSYPFQRSRYWAEEGDRSPRPLLASGGAGPGAHPFLQRHVTLAEGNGTQVFEGEIGIPGFPYLRDHRVQDGAVVPATAWAEMALGAFTAAQGPGPVVMEGIEYEKPLFLSEEARFRVQVALHPSAACTTFSISSRRADAAAGGWTKHVTGRVRAGQPTDRRHQRDVAALRARCPEEVAGVEFYRLLRERGNAWGPAFQGIERLWRSEGEAWSLVQVPAGLQPEVALYLSHPAVADATGQVLTATVPLSRSGGPRGGAFVGGGIEEVRVYRPLRGTRMWAHARLREPGDHGSNLLVGDVEVFDDAGELVSEVRGAKLWYLDPETAVTRGQNVEDWYYQVDWLPSPRPTAAERPAAGRRAARWVVVGEPSALAHGLVRELRQRGHACELAPVPAEDVPGWAGAAGNDEGTVLGGLVYLAVPETRGVPGEAAGVDGDGCATAVLGLVRVLHSVQTGTAPRLWIVTRGGQPAGTSPVIDPGGGALWGIGRSLAVEHAELWGGLVDLDPAAPPEESAARLADHLVLRGPDDQVAFRATGQYVARLVRVRPKRSAATALRPDASYLVTGGFRGLGLAVARSLVERGARHLILVARTPLPPRAAWLDPADPPQAAAVAAVRELEALGADVLPVTLDVADAEALSAWLGVFRREGRPPIRGVVHAAGVLAHRPLVAETADSLRAVLRPKVHGALALHRAFEGDPLDFFVLFSSAASVLNSPLLGAYAAANAFLDGLAHYRRGRGLRALSVNWGVWGETGMATRFQAEDVAALAQRGMGTIPTTEGLEALWRLVDLGIPQAAVLPVDWAEWARRYPAFAAASFFSEIVALVQVGTEARAEGGPGPATREALWTAPPEERKRLVQAVVAASVAQVMRVEPRELEAQQPLQALGLDSLMAVEIRNRLEAALGVGIPLVSLLEGPSVSALATTLVAKIGCEAGGRAETSGATAESTGSTAGAELDPQAAERLRRERADGSPTTFPLSLGQQALWFFSLLAPESAAYNIAFWARLRSVDRERLRGALTALVERHPMLRTAFDVTEHGPQHRVAPSNGACLQEVDASQWDDETLHRQVVDAYRRPFDLETGQVFRAVLFSRTDGRHTLLLAAHHIVFDAWSLGIVLRDLAALYDAPAEGARTALPSLQKTYADFVRWQAETLHSARGQALWDYWRERLAGAAFALALRTDHPRPHTQTYGAASHRFWMTERVSAGLRTLARTEGATPFMALATAFAIFLHRYSGQPEVLIGTPMQGRPGAEFEPVVGYFVNPVVLRVHVSDDASFRQQLAEMRQIATAALAHGDYPFPELVRRLQPKRDAGRSPLFQAVFNFVKADHLGVAGRMVDAAGGGSQVRLGSLALDEVTVEQPGGQFDLELDVLDGRSAMLATLTYNRDLFEGDTIAGMADRFAALVADIVADPDRPVSRLLPGVGDVDHLPAGAWQGPFGAGVGAVAPPQAAGRAGMEDAAVHREVFEL